MIRRSSSHRVLMTTDAVGGVWTYAIELCRSLPEMQFVLATMGPPPSREQRREVSRLGNVTLEVGRFKLEWMDDPWLDVQTAGEWLLALEHRHSPDVIHLNGYVHGALPWNAPVLMVAHSCVLSWWRAVKGESAPAGWSNYRQAVASGIAAADRLVAPTEAMLRCVRRHYRRVPDCSVIPNAVDPEPFRGGEKKEPLVLSAGRLWDEAKNAAALAAVAPDLPWPVVLAGETGENAAPVPNVRFAGRCAPREMAQWFRRASIYALPARYEPFGLSALEAAHAGAALVLGDIPSLREVWGDAAAFVPPDDRAALRNTLLHLVRNPRERAALAARAQERAETYSIPRMRGSYLSTYRAIISRSQPLLRPA